VKFLCSHCKAKYQIPDEKVAGRTLRMTCRNCQQEIVIRSEPAAPARRASVMVAPPPSALGADFQRRVAGSLLPSPPQVTVLDEWHVAVNDTPVGPIDRDEVARMLAAGTLNADSLAWREGLDDWLPVRRIAELAVLCMPPAQIPAPPTFVQPAQRAELSPIGGRAGAAPAFTLEDWAPPDPSTSQVGLNPLLSAGQSERRAMPSMPVMFALFGGFAFLMSAMAIVGARWLQTEAPAPAPAAALQPAAPTAPTAAVREDLVEPAEDPGGEMVIELDDLDLSGSVSRARTGSGGASKPTGKKLTAEQQAMLARMGGGDGSDVSALRGVGSNVPSAGSSRQAGGLTSEQLSRVVLGGRKNLQRCYETALRGSGSTDTVRMDVEVGVSPAGNVTKVQARGPALPGMAECIERTVRMWRFPQASEPTQTKFPVVFQPGA
jgi:hypothetical protein